LSRTVSTERRETSIAVVGPPLACAPAIAIAPLPVQTSSARARPQLCAQVRGEEPRVRAGPEDPGQGDDAHGAPVSVPAAGQTRE